MDLFQVCDVCGQTRSCGNFFLVFETPFSHILYDCVLCLVFLFYYLGYITHAL